MTAPEITLTVCAAALAVGALFTIILYWIYSFVFKRARTDCDKFSGLDSKAMAPYREKNRESITRLSELEYEDVYIDSPLDGTRLHARLKLSGEGSPIQIMCHGYRSNPFRDFSGGALEALANGHSVLIIDQRAHGESEGKAITFGIRERHDLLGWVNYVNGRFPEREIVLVGISMGGATVVAASEYGMPSAVKCIVADCPYSCVRDELTHSAKKMGFPRAVYPLIRLAGRAFGGFDTEDGDFRKSAAKTRLPIIILHGDSDGLVPSYMSEQLRDAAPEKIRHITFAGADHGISYLVDRERYVNEVYGFINEHLSADISTN